MAKHLLVADDSLTIRKMVEITFAREPVRVTAAGSVEEALQAARKDRPDIVLADSVMPGSTGYDLCAALRKDTTLAQVPVIILAGNATPYDETRGRQVRADGFIIKPFETQALIDKVNQILARAPRVQTAQGIPAKPAVAPRPFPEPKLPEKSRPPIPDRVPDRTATPSPSSLGGALSARMAALPSGSPRASLGRITGEMRIPPAEPRPSMVEPRTTMSEVRAPVVEPRISTSEMRASVPLPLARPPMIGGGRPWRGSAIASAETTSPTREMPIGLAATALEATAGSLGASRSAVLDRVDEKMAALMQGSPEVAAVATLSREIIERIAWEIVPDLAEVIIRSELERLTREKKS